MKQFLIFNESKRVTNKEFKAMVAAINTQAKSHFCPEWGLTPVPVKAAPAGAQPDEDNAGPGVYMLHLQDDPDAEDAGALGYHTEEGDHEWGVVFVNPVLDNGGAVNMGAKGDLSIPTVASVLSHEVLELLADPFVNAWVDGPRIAQGNLYSLEVCDPVEQDQYEIGGVAVSNFVLPEWFNADTSRKDQYDYLGLLKKPFTMTAGGYMVVRGAGGSHEVFARKAPAKWRHVAKAANPRSRKNKRMAAS